MSNKKEDFPIRDNYENVKFDEIDGTINSQFIEDMTSEAYHLLSEAEELQKRAIIHKCRGKKLLALISQHNKSQN